jgi:pimeloyl-ACP methyl ester carboxylesterase
MARRPRLVEESVVLIDGPWTHRQINANGIGLHIVEAGEGPLVLLLHGFPEFWWSWRHQLTALANAGFHAVAVDLRGYGASDKPPRGYDSLTLAADVAGLIRALGERHAAIIGHDWGAHLAWTLGAVSPEHVRQIVAVSVPHPLRWARAVTRVPGQRGASGYIGRFQLPWHPERWLVADQAAHVGELLHRWGGPEFPDTQTEARCREAMLIRSVPHCSLEWYRWALRSIPRADGRRYRGAMRGPIEAPVLQLHGELDRCVLPSTARGSDRWVAGPYRWISYDAVGHFPHEEIPDRVTADILDWITTT